MPTNPSLLFFHKVKVPFMMLSDVPYLMIVLSEGVDVFLLHQGDLFIDLSLLI